MSQLPLCNLPYDQLFPIFSKTSLSTLCLMRKASNHLDRAAENYRNELVRKRKDNLSVVVNMSENDFTVSVKDRVLPRPTEQLSGMKVVRIEINEMQNVFQMPILKEFIQLLVHVFPYKKSMIDWEKYPMCAFLDITRSAQITCNCDQVPAAIGKLAEEIFHNGDFYFPSILAIKGYGDGPLPTQLTRVWTFTNGPSYLVLFTIPKAVYAFGLPSDRIMIVFEYSERRSRHPVDSLLVLMQEEPYQTAKVTVVKKDMIDINAAIYKNIYSHRACNNVKQEISMAIAKYIRE